MPPKKKSSSSARKAGRAKVATRKAPAKRPVAARTVRKAAVRSTGKEPQRYICKLCGYVYSPKIGEPHRGIPAGTAFEDLPDDYVCLVCGFAGKGKVGKWGFEIWVPTRYVCKVCGYIYDQARGEPQHGIKAGTPFEKLPASYVCPVCGLDVKITRDFGKVGKAQFEPLLL